MEIDVIIDAIETVIKDINSEVIHELYNEHLKQQYKEALQQQQQEYRDSIFNIKQAVISDFISQVGWNIDVKSDIRFKKEVIEERMQSLKGKSIFTFEDEYYRMFSTSKQQLERLYNIGTSFRCKLGYINSVMSDIGWKISLVRVQETKGNKTCYYKLVSLSDYTKQPKKVIKTIEQPTITQAIKPMEQPTITIEQLKKVIKPIEQPIVKNEINIITIKEQMDKAKKDKLIKDAFDRQIKETLIIAGRNSKNKHVFNKYRNRITNYIESNKIKILNPQTLYDDADRWRIKMMRLAKLNNANN